MPGRGSFRRRHAVAIFVAANLTSALPAGLGGDFNFYNSFRQPAVAPPDWVFGLVWLVLNIISLVALYRVAARILTHIQATWSVWCHHIQLPIWKLEQGISFGGARAISLRRP